MAEKKKTPNEIFRELKGNASGSESTRQTPNEVFAKIMSRANAANHVKEANRFIVDVNKFSRAVDEDTSGENQFNAADYFEERKKQAEQLKRRAAAMSLYMNDHADSFIQESYDRMMSILATFDTDVDDVMSRYQPSLDSKAGMRAYEDELRAAMDRNAQLNQLEGMAAYALDPGDFWGNLMRQGRNTEGNRGINDNWSAEQRYRLGQMQMNDPNEAKKYAAQVNAGQDPYLLYQQQEQQKADWRALDLNAEKREIDRLKAELDAHQNRDFDFTSSSARKSYEQETQRLEKEISDREQQYNLAKREQDSAQFRSAVDQSDFASRSGYVSTGEIPTYVDDADPNALVYEYINDPEIRSQINQQTTDLAAKGYDLLEEEEVAIYNYYYATEGPEKAQQYLDNIQDTLNQRIGERGAASKDNIWKQLMAGAIAGYSNAVNAPQYFFDRDSDYINTNPSQYMSAAIREDLADTGPVLPGVPGGASMGQMAYDLVNTTANMAPAMLLSGAANLIVPGSGAVVGSTAMGLSAAGGAYQQALNAGYSKEQARNYAALSGASEIALEYLLGGISKLGGEIPQSIIREIVGGIDNAIARAAITLGGSMASEGFEEGLQEVITPWIENLTLYAGKNVDWNEVAYSTLLGALSGGVMEGPGVAVNTSRVSKIEGQLKNLGAKDNTLDLSELIVKHRSGEQLSEDEYKKLVKSEPAMKILEGMRSAEPTEPAIANMTAEQVEEMKPTTSKDGNARQISRNESINVMEFAEVKDGKATVKTDSGTVDYSDVSFGTEKHGNQYFAVESLPAIDTAHANDLLRTIQNADVGNDTSEVVAIREAYRLGYMGASTRDLRGSDAKILPTNLQDKIYDIGRQQRSANDAVRATAKITRAKATEGYKKVIIEGKLSQMTGEAEQKRKAEIDYVDRIADTFSGTAVHVYESYQKNGKMYYRDNNGVEQLAPNGKYVNDEIWVDLNSGDKGEGMMLNTFAHEMYHHIEKWNKPKARELAEFVVKELGLESVDKAVQKQIDKARAAGYGEKYFQDKQHMTAEQAKNEVYMRAMSDFVADSLETMFTQGDPAKAIANLKKDNRGLFDQIKAFIDEWISKVKQFYSDKTISKEGAMVAQLEKFEQLQQMFMEAMQGAGENYRKTQPTINNREKQTQEEKKAPPLKKPEEKTRNEPQRIKEPVTEPRKANEEKKAPPLKKPEEKTRNEPQRIKEPVMARDTTHAVKKVYFQEVTISPNTAFFSSDVKPKESNIPFTLYSDNTVGLDIDNSKYKEGFATIKSVYNTFSGYYEFAIDGEKVSEGDIFKDGKYYTFDDIKRPVVKEIQGGNYVLVEKGVLNFYSDFREVKTRAVKKQETSVVYTTLQKDIVPGKSGEVFNADGDPVAMSTEDGSVMLSIRTYEEDGREAFRKYLDKCVTSNRLTEEQAKEMRDGIEEIYNVCKEFKDKYAPFSTWSDAEVIRDTRGRPVFSVVTPNGDYKMNLDFSLVCKKRRTLDAVFNEMSRRGIIDDFELGQKSVVKINEIIRKHDLETACALCFVDDKRFRQASMADSFTRLYNELVESLVPEDQKVSINHFNFSGYETIKKVDGGIDTWDNSKLDFSHLDDVMKRYGKGTVEYKAARYIKNNPQGRKLLLRGDFMSSQGFDAVKTQNKDILKLYNSKKGTGGPKAAFGDVQYLNEIIKKERTWTPSKAYEVGGIRIQSFSDYVPRMVFDYTQMIYDLSARKLPAHAYTKESLFVKQFGLTGVKINMSLIPAVAEGGIAPGLDAKGNYVWAGESFNYDEAVEIQNAEGYTENCGTICVGVSKQHIEKLLRDPNIRMVIPYHKSGLNPIVAHMNKIAEFTDYTNDQRTKGKDGKAVSKDFNFNEAVKRTGDPKAVADEYLKWCADNGYTPKFDEFKKEENYYKLLEDFTLYDKDGKYVPQREVRAAFPSEGSAFGTMKELIKAGLEEDAIVEGKRDKNLSSIVDEIQNTLPKTEAEISEEQVKQADRDLEADVMFSLRSFQRASENALEEFGTTTDFAEVGFILPNGKMLRFTDDDHPGERIYDHRAIGKAYGVNVDLNENHGFNYESNDYMDEFIENGGIRFDPGDLEFNMDAGMQLSKSVPITKEQEQIIRDFIEWKKQREDNYSAEDDPLSMYSGPLTLHIEFGANSNISVSSGAKDLDSWGIKHLTYEGGQINASRVITDIRHYYKTGETRKPSMIAQFHFQHRNQKATAREILMQTDPQTQKNNVKGHLTRYQERVTQLGEAEARREEVKAQIETLSADPKKNRKELAQLRTESRNLTTQINGLKEKLKFSENTDMMRKIVANERLKNQPPAKSYKDEQEDFIRSMLAEHRVIRKELTGADSVMFVMEDTFVKLAKDYEAKKIDMMTMEKEFMRIMKEYEKQTEKSAKKAEKDSEKIEDLKAQNKIWLREYKRLRKEYDLSDRKIARLEATIARQRATSKARVEGRRKTEIRHKIQRKVNELDQLLRHGTKHRNVPEFLQDSVAAVLQAINMEVRDSDQRRKTYESTIARYDRQIELATDPLVKEALIEKRDNYAAKGDQFANRMAMLQKAYEQIRKENTGLELDEGIAEHLNSLFETVGDTPLGQMTATQLDAVNDILNVTMATVRNANEMLAEARAAGVVESSKSAIMEIKSAGETKKKKTRLRKNLEQFGWNNLKPVYAFDVIGSKTLTDRYEALRKGEDTLAVDLNEAKEFFQEQWKKNGGKEWDMEQKWKFTSTSGKSFELDLNQIMSLYALAKDKDARSHLRVGGFAFDSDYQTQKRGPLNIPIKVESTDASAYNLSDEILGEIISTLTPQQRAFADAMQEYLSDTMAAKGNEVSLKKYGIRLFKKKDYFPIRVADQFMAKAREQQAGDRKLKDAGFTKDRKPEAKNPVVLSGFTEVWAEHVDEMSLYHSFVLPLDDFNRVLNYHDAFVEGEQSASVVEAITNAFGKGAVNYIDQLIKDVNGGIKGGSTVSFANSLVSKAKKAQTMASLSVAIQQPSSIIRAMSEVDTKYFYGPRVTEKSHDRTWDEIKKHAPIAIIKEMGGYDTNVGKSTVDYLTDTADYDGFGEKFKAMFTDEKFRDDALGRLPALMDEMSWGVIWNAVKREQRDRHPNMDTKSDAFMKLVANRFTEVITRTQVYDSVFSRSGLMRDRKSDLAKMITSFMAEPTTTANMLAVSILQATRGDIKGKQTAKTIGSIVASLALNAALVSVIYALRDDDEDKRYGEKYVENFRNNFFESLNPLGYIPYVRDIYNLFAKGYDVERADMELFGDLQNAIEGLGNEDITAWEKTENVIGSIGNLLGVPVKNILRDVKGVVQTLGFAWDDKPNPKTKTGTYMAWRGMDLNDKEQMILAIQSGDEEHLQRVFGRFENQQKAESALQSAIKAKYLEDGLTAEETEEMLTTYFDRDDEFEIYWLMEEWDYAKANDGSTDGYTKYGSLYKAIETGDFETEIARFLEHGADASTIRSQITREYRKQYLADETAREDIREKLLPVYEATGMYASDIEDKFNDWDFEAEYGMTYSNFKAEYLEGNVIEAEMRSAMDAYGLLNYEIEEGIRDLNDDIAFEKKFGMSMSELKDAYDNGDATRNQLIEALMFTGKTKTEATEEVSERDLDNRFGIQYAKLDDAYKYNDISRSEFYNAMREHGATQQEADEAILGYDWLKKNVKKYPDLAISDAKRFVIKVSDKMEERTLTDYGVSVDAYLKYKEGAKDCPGVDADGDGKIDSYSKAKQLFAMIDQLPISDEAKDGLALVTNAMSTVKKYAPWHK